MSMTVLRNRRKQRSGLRPRSPIVVAIQKAAAPIRPVRRSRYPDSVSERKIDRAAWSDVVSELIATETRGKKAPFARLVGVDPRTIDHWLKGTVNVMEESVRRVARATGRAPMDMLVRVGYYQRDEIGAAVDQPAPDPDDEAMRLIIDSPFPPRLKVRMIQRLEELRARDRQREADEVRFWIEQAGEQNPNETPDRA